MKKIKKSAGLLDEWIDSQIEHSAQDPNVGFVETLYQTCSIILIHLWRSHLRFTLHGPRLNTMKRDVANMRLWEDSFSAGRLDIILGQSSRLKTNVVENLKGIGEILIYYIVGSDDTIINTQVESSSVHLVKELRILLDNAAIILSAEERSNSSSDEDTSDNSSSTTDCEMNRYGRLHSYIVCLMDLVPAIERHALCLQQRVTQLPHSRDTVLNLSKSALPFARRINDRFATTPTSLVNRLAEANWERFVRIRNKVEEEDEGVTTTLFKPYSLFHDSGIGTSLFTNSQYAATAVSHKSFLSTAEEQSQGHPRVPHLLHDQGLPFKCEYCQKVVIMRNRIDWKMHVFADLQSYICTHEECQDALKTFTSRDTWARHEINEHLSQSQWRCYKCKITTTTQENFVKHLNMAHGIALSGHLFKATIAEAEETVLKPDFEDHRCPFCFQSGWKTTKDYATHVGRHLEEISLACLPMDQDCDSDVDSEIDLSSNATTNNLPLATTNNDHDSALIALPDSDNVENLEEQNHNQNFKEFSGSEHNDLLQDVQSTTRQAIQQLNSVMLPGKHDQHVPHPPAPVLNIDGMRMDKVKKKSFRCFKCDTEYGASGALQRHIEERHHHASAFAALSRVVNIFPTEETRVEITV